MSEFDFFLLLFQLGQGKFADWSYVGYERLSYNSPPHYLMIVSYKGRVFVVKSLDEFGQVRTAVDLGREIERGVLPAPKQEEYTHPSNGEDD